MFRTTHRITRNREDAEDAVQECFLNAFLHLKNFDGRSRFSTWLTRIAMNAALMKLRKNHASREVPIAMSVETSELSSGHQVSDLSPNPEEHCMKSEQEAILRGAIAKLRPRIRKVECSELCRLLPITHVLRLQQERALCQVTCEHVQALNCRHSWTLIMHPPDWKG